MLFRSSLLVQLYVLTSVQFLEHSHSYVFVSSSELSPKEESQGKGIFNVVVMFLQDLSSLNHLYVLINIVFLLCTIKQMDMLVQSGMSGRLGCLVSGSSSECRRLRGPVLVREMERIAVGNII